MKRENFRQLVDRSLPVFSVPMSPERAGTRTSAIGASLENLLVMTHKGYESHGLGVVTKNHVRTRAIHGKTVYCEKQTVDYCGYLKDIGFVAFDAKSTDADCFRVDRRALHQFLYLRRGMMTLNFRLGRFFYLIEHRSAQSVLAVYLVTSLQRIHETGRYEFAPQDIVPYGTGGVLIDYRTKLLEENKSLDAHGAP